MKFSVENAINRCLKKFNMVNCRTVVSPCVPSVALLDSPKNSVFPLRSLIGSLQYFACLFRPDSAYSVNRIARHVTEPTDACVSAAKRILQYLKGTIDQGAVYTPESERAFKETYSKIARSGKQELPDTVAFADVDFAGCCVTLKSTTGAIMYHRGTPITWLSKRQTIRAASTCEAEYVALYDTIRLCQSQGYLDWFLLNRDLPLVFSDNMSALHLAANSLITKRSKHIALRYHKIRDHVKDLRFCPTEKNMADPLTKSLSGGKYIKIFTPGFQDTSPPSDENHNLI